MKGSWGVHGGYNVKDTTCFGFASSSFMSSSEPSSASQNFEGPLSKKKVENLGFKVKVPE